MAQKELVLDVNENPKKLSHWIIFAFQHVLAMLVACITVPLLTGLPIAPTLIAAGFGTLIYIFFTKKKSPIFLSSSFSYITPMVSALGVGLMNNAVGNNYLALILGMLMVGLVYVLIAILIKFCGSKFLDKLLPPIVVGPVIMVIGLYLAGSAVNNLQNTAILASNYNLIHILCGFVALVVTAICAHYGRGKFISLIPFVIGMLSGYAVALLFTLFGYTLGGAQYFKVIDFAPFIKIFGKGNFSFASIINYKIFVPNDPESFIFLKFNEISKFDWGKIGQVAIIFVPVAFVTICEHIGDHENLGHILNRDLLGKEPGITRTLIGDGVATAVSGAICGAANTTYGENVAVVGTTGIASTNVVLLAAIFSIFSGFITPFTAFLQTIPGCVTGGVSLILYGFIASSGIRMLIREKINLGNTRNIFIASVILIIGIGGFTLKIGKVDAPIIEVSQVAMSMICGVILNFILKPEKEHHFVNEENKEEK